MCQNTLDQTRAPISRKRCRHRRVTVSGTQPRGTLLACGCSRLSSAELLFEKQRANAEFYILER